jgi:hypothetical protein
VVHASLNAFIDSLQFACEVQGVIAMRLLRLARGGPQATMEAHEMIAEKLDALADAEVALLKALANGEGAPIAAADQACEPMRRRVRANSRRLLGATPERSPFNCIGGRCSLT